MKHRKHYLSLILLILTFALLAGCGHQATASDRFKDFTNAWQKKNFSKMYTYLSKSTKKSVSKSNFIERYQRIYDGVEAGKLTASIKATEGNTKSVSFKSVLATAAGPVHFSGKAVWVKEKHGDTSNWYLNWKPGFILPGMTGKDKIRVSTLPANRGSILDRNGKPLAYNGPAARIDLVPGKLGSGKGRDQTLKKIAKLLGMTPAQINQTLKQSWVQADSLVPMKVVAASDTSLIKKVTSLPGVYKTQIQTRAYPDKQASGHLTGYVGQVTADILKAHPNEGYTADSVIGRTGLEQLYENKLRARDGAVIQILNANGSQKKILARKQAQNGQDIRLTIDQKVQDTLYGQLKKDSGSAVALDPKTGDVLGLVSAPSYDPNDFVRGLSAADYTKLSQAKSQPLLNRFTEATAPGSTFKALTAAIALDHHSIDPNHEVKISGKSWQQDKSWGNYHVTRLDSAPSVNLEEALYRSDNIYFAQTALKIGASSFISGSKEYGLGESIPFPYPMQKSTLSTDGKLDNSMLLANSGYGQGQVSVTPLQMSLIYSAFVNRGNIIKPRLIKNSQAPQMWKKHVMSASTAQLLNKDLAQVIDNPAGTAHDAAISGLPMAGKTGTPEFKKKQGKTGRENGWFVAYNTKNPKLLVTMVVENTQKHGGSHYVTPKIKAVFQQYFNK
ncbi:MAG: penicillin-binding transpeptidase domain-containing protein [Sporolactobacillus sp.]